MTIDAGLRAGQRIAAERAPLRIFCANGQLATGVIHGLAAAWIPTPQAAAVVGYGDLALSMRATGELTTIGQPKHEMGAAAVARLLAELREGRTHQHTATVFSPHLIVRRSTVGRR